MTYNRIVTHAPTKWWLEIVDFAVDDRLAAVLFVVVLGNEVNAWKIVSADVKNCLNLWVVKERVERACRVIRYEDIGTCPLR